MENINETSHDIFQSFLRRRKMLLNVMKPLKIIIYQERKHQRRKNKRKRNDNGLELTGIENDNQFFLR